MFEIYLVKIQGYSTKNQRPMFTQKAFRAFVIAYKKPREKRVEKVSALAVSSQMFCFLLFNLVNKPMIISFHAFGFLFLFIRDKSTCSSAGLTLSSNRVYHLLNMRDRSTC